MFFSINKEKMYSLDIISIFKTSNVILKSSKENCNTNQDIKIIEVIKTLCLKLFY